ncbi:hypothetical protein ESCAB7627_3851 [Escherichia albertii TW07627]|uniref:Uncharacterized protein n=1 Tax=Escherichia albertii (strain TW07627) TaxID=502347 RepID=A0ABC9NJN3_ESCAT|nr:hypothetical protein ESCAB7627_3851 [Escherichia albertii TW07627]
MVDFSRITGGWESPVWVIFAVQSMVQDAPPDAAYPAYG